MKKFENLSIKGKLLILILFSLIGYVIFFLLQSFYLKEAILREKKLDLMNKGEIALSVVKNYYNLYQAGNLTEEEAKEKAKLTLKSLRYEEGINYFWINDGTLPYPIMIMHPTVPQLEGKPLSDSKFNVAYMRQTDLSAKEEKVNNQNLFTLLVETASKTGHAFVWYKWPKPLKQGGVTQEFYPKLSYVVKFEPWNWYIGTGIYIDDVDKAFTQAIKRNIIKTVVIIFGILFIVVLLAFLSVRSISNPISELEEKIRLFGQGNLNIQFKTQRKDEIGKIANSLDEAVNNLKAIIFSVKDVSENLSQLAVGLTNASNQFKDNLDLQTEKASQIASAAEEMSITVVDIAKNTTNILEESKKTAEIAKEGENYTLKTASEVKIIEKTTNKLKEVMYTLEERTKAIENVIEFIKDVAEQTNLLALNATIEAARAGEHGKSFAVVAGEIRKLAERTNKSTDEIANTIREIKGVVSEVKQEVEDIGKKVENGTKLSEDAAAILAKIADAAERLQEMIQSIASATEEMSVTSEAVAKDVGSVAEGVQELKKNISILLDTTEDIKKIEEELREKTSVFTL
ncbi:methyl-accepting chemotaxis protein [Thermodesulfobacterium sp. TA1]|uniref:methyl-accepting chemotaxis protein n=1 Tax=Thermodesulfobacterium sp. TA1 TaxID=2234087 RepID=UPI0012324B35|nr:methyl-accepting chemotaxis protein [Thermodesulfobacterium sp. TA1]QER41935.1 methyl-accepting chemotaxis protein [Thermodesulfobacterium sp. TA1]